MTQQKIGGRTGRLRKKEIQNKNSSFPERSGAGHAHLKQRRKGQLPLPIHQQEIRMQKHKVSP